MFCNSLLKLEMHLAKFVQILGGERSILQQHYFASLLLRRRGGEAAEKRGDGKWRENTGEVVAWD
jgi:hypothetical protein